MHLNDTDRQQVPGSSTDVTPAPRAGVPPAVSPLTG